MAEHKDTPKQSRFDFKQMKSAATSESRAIRKRSFTEYFERFQEFPAYLFDNESKIDEKLRTTIEDLLGDPETTKAMRAGIEILMRRLPS